MTDTGNKSHRTSRSETRHKLDPAHNAHNPSRTRVLLAARQAVGSDDRVSEGACCAVQNGFSGYCAWLRGDVPTC